MARLSLLYNHTLLQFLSHNASNSPSLASGSQLYFTEAVRHDWILPKEVLRQEIIFALRDCPNSVLFLAVLCKHENESLFVGVDDRVWLIRSLYESTSVRM